MNEQSQLPMGGPVAIVTGVPRGKRVEEARPWGEGRTGCQGVGEKELGIIA